MILSRVTFSVKKFLLFLDLFLDVDSIYRYIYSILHLHCEESSNLFLFIWQVLHCFKCLLIQHEIHRISQIIESWYWIFFSLLKIICIFTFLSSSTNMCLVGIFVQTSMFKFLHLIWLFRGTFLSTALYILFSVACGHWSFIICLNLFLWHTVLRYSVVLHDTRQTILFL